MANLIVYIASILMAYNIFCYIRFSRHVRRQGNWSRDSRLFIIPIILLILFLAGYLSIAIFGHPDLIMVGILFGGSIFVFATLSFIQRMVDRIYENERLKAKLAVSEEASKAKTFFLSNMSHDIRTPLNAIIGYSTLAGREGVTSEQKTDYIRKIEKASHQLLEIVNDVLEMSRIESGKIELEPAPVNLEDCMKEAGDLIRVQLAEKKIDFSVCCDITHKWVLCDRTRLNRALMNLLSNAGKFTGEHGKVSLQLMELSGDEEIRDYEIRVRDTGIGMSPEFVEHLFTPFEREKTSTISRIQGTGLGMAITKNIVDLMGGTIEVITEQGKGTEFIITVSLPVVEAPEEKMGVNEPGEMHFDGIRALLVEDNPINMEIARMLLTQAGFIVETAENGKQAVEMTSSARSGWYDVILMDIQMPVMDGYTAAREIRALPDPDQAGIPIIAMTANAYQDDIRMAKEAGMNGHIAKPLDIQNMMRTLEEVLRT